MHDSSNILGQVCLSSMFVHRKFDLCDGSMDTIMYAGSLTSMYVCCKIDVCDSTKIMELDLCDSSSDICMLDLRDSSSPSCCL